MRLFCAGLAFAAGCAGTATNLPEQSAQAQRESESTPPEPEQRVTEEKESDPNEPLWWKYGKEGLSRWPKRLIADSKESFLRADNMTALLLAGGASIIMHNTHADTNIERHFDKHPSLHGFEDESLNVIGQHNTHADTNIERHFDKHPSLHGFEDESLNVIGHPATHIGASSLWCFLSAENDDRSNWQRAWTMRTALMLNWLATMGLKLARNNETPNGKDYAWPSGHTSSSFTVASVLDELYGPRVGIPAYVVASAVAYRMMDTGDHWASDVVFGATLGWVVGHTVAGKHKKLEVAGFDVVPYVGHTEESTVGVGLLKQF
jgi:diadenosine tetraphosphatase ApaH/serine/threonine PP2A family protein phosphatase